jgi:general stress protein 26
MTMPDKREETLLKINSLMKDITVAMVTTNENGMFRSRPMRTHETAFDGYELWFFTHSQTHTAADLAGDDRVSVNYVSCEENTYIAFSGRAELIDDPQILAEFWSPVHQAWFPKGLADPNLALLKVSVEHVEFWDAAASSLVEAFGILKQIMTGKRAVAADHVAMSVA